MENFERLKEELKTEIERELHQIDPSIDLNGCLDLYYQVIKFKYSEPTNYDLSGLSEKVNRTLTDIFISKKNDKILLFDFCKTFEVYIKMLYHVLLEGEFIKENKKIISFNGGTIGSYLRALDFVKLKFKDKTGNDVEEDYAFNRKISTKDGEQQFFKYVDLNLDSLNNSTEQEVKIYITDNNRELYLFYLIQSYKYKNITSHQEPNLSINEAHKRFTTTFICQIHLIHFFRREIKKSLSRFSFRQEDFNIYLDNLESKFKAKKNRYISLSLLEIRDDAKEAQTGLIEEIISMHPRLRLLAQAGCGKTTTLEYLTYKNVKRYRTDKNNVLPVLIYLGNLAKEQSIINAISNQINRTEEETQILLKENRIQLYLDGINEINTSLNDKKKKIEEINDLLMGLPKLFVLITDRFVNDIEQTNFFPSLTTLEIVKLNEQQIDSFIDEYIRNEETKAIAKKIITENKKLNHLFEKPLFLSRALEIINIKHELPSGEGKIIGNFIEIILNREKNEKADTWMNIKEFKKIYAYLAHCIYEKNKSNVINAPIHELNISKYIKEGAEFFGIENSVQTGYPGYMKRIGLELEILVINDDYVKFFHDNYFEYFHSQYMLIESILE